MTPHVRQYNNLQLPAGKQTIYMQCVTPINYHFILHEKFKLPTAMQYKYYRNKVGNNVVVMPESINNCAFSVVLQGHNNPSILTPPKRSLKCEQTNEMYQENCCSPVSMWHEM